LCLERVPQKEVTIEGLTFSCYYCPAVSAAAGTVND